VALPLSGVRVLDFGQGVAGPYCAQLLGDQGADVIKIEPPRGDWARTMGVTDAQGFSGTFVSVNRNKQGVCLDLKSDEAIDLARRLALKADVLVESFRSGVMDRLGLGYQALSKLHPRLIYVSITGFGADGPYAPLPAGDSTIQGFGGLMSIVGTPDGEPLRIGNVVSDMLAGGNAFAGALLALLKRAASGRGSRVETNLLDSIVAFQAPPLTEYLLTGRLPTRAGNDHPLIAPSGAIATADGAVLFTVLDHQWPDFCRALGLTSLLDDPRFASSALRQQHRASLRAALEPVFRSRTSAAWLEVLRKSDVLCAPINDYEALAADPQVRHNGLIQAADGCPDIPLIRNPVRLDDTKSPRMAPPRLGQHTRSVLESDLRLTAAEIDRLIARRAAYGDVPATEAVA